MKRKPFLCAIFLCVIAAAASGQIDHRLHEQTTFYFEAPPGEKYVDRPKAVPEEVAEILRGTDELSPCYKGGGDRDQVRASWFVGSEIHLAKPDGRDLIVMPAYMEGVDVENRCFLGAHTGPFWILRKVANSYELLLETEATTLEVLTTRANGYRDIKANTPFVAGDVTVWYQFDGRTYKRTKVRDRRPRYKRD